MAKKKKPVGNRRWLNTSKDLHAFISWDVSGKRGTATIMDCYRKIELEFEWGKYCDTTKRQALAKLDRLRSELDDLRAAIVSADD